VPRNRLYGERKENPEEESPRGASARRKVTLASRQETPALRKALKPRASTLARNTGNRVRRRVCTTVRGQRRAKARAAATEEEIPEGKSWTWQRGETNPRRQVAGCGGDVTQSAQGGANRRGREKRRGRNEARAGNPAQMWTPLLMSRRGRRPQGSCSRLRAGGGCGSRAL
jgi:hypothetical protein